MGPSVNQARWLPAALDKTLAYGDVMPDRQILRPRWLWTLISAALLAPASGCGKNDGCAGGDCPRADLGAPDNPDGSAGADLAGIPPGADLAMSTPDLAEVAVDPGRPGTRGTVGFDVQVPLTGGALSTTVVGPSDDARTLSMVGAPYPLVIIAPGFTIPRSQYRGYADRLASHGFLAVLVDPRKCGILVGCDHEAIRTDNIKLIDWLLTPTGTDASKVAGRADLNRIGLTGHSLGGKVSLLIAEKDTRIKAVLGIDPVDSGVGMQPSALTNIGALRLGPGVPLGLLGETISQSGAQPCAPKGQNYQAYYDAYTGAAFAITFTGAAHNDFVDNFSACAQCGFACPGSTAKKEDTRDLGHKYVAAYFLWALAGKASARDYLLGAAFDADAATGAVSRKNK